MRNTGIGSLAVLAALACGAIPAASAADWSSRQTSRNAGLRPLIDDSDDAFRLSARREQPRVSRRPVVSSDNAARSNSSRVAAPDASVSSAAGKKTAFFFNPNPWFGYGAGGCSPCYSPCRPCVPSCGWGGGWGGGWNGGWGGFGGYGSPGGFGGYGVNPIVNPYGVSPYGTTIVAPGSTVPVFGGPNYIGGSNIVLPPATITPVMNPGFANPGLGYPGTGFGSPYLNNNPFINGPFYP